MRYGLIAGNGRFPVLALENARKLGHEVVAIGIQEEAYEGWLMLLGAVFVASMVLWMLRTAKGLKRAIETRIALDLQGLLDWINDPATPEPVTVQGAGFQPNRLGAQNYL